MSVPAFAITDLAVFFGYVLTPIHRWISASVEYFKTSMGTFLRCSATPAAIGPVVSLVVGLLLL